MSADGVARSASPMGEPTAPSPFPWGLFLGFSLLVLAGTQLLFGLLVSVHQDFAGSLLSAKLVVALGDAYRQFIVYFPPAERIWFSIAVRIADLTGARLDLVGVAMVTVAVLASAGLAYDIKRRTVGATAGFLMGSIAAMILFPLVFKNVFGLREHMVALGIWPYLVLRLCDPEGEKIGWRTRALVGVWLGVMLLAKYLYSIIVLLVELSDAVAHRRLRSLFRIENLIAGGIVAAYLLLWLGLDSDQRAAIGAMASAIDASLVSPKQAALEAANGLYFALFFFIVRRMFAVPAAANRLGLCLVLGSVIVAAAQGRWYSHHLFPIIAAYGAWWWMAGRRFAWWAHVVVAVFLALPTFDQFRTIPRYQQGVVELRDALHRERVSVDGKRVGILAMHPSPLNQYLAMEGGTRWNALMNNAYVSAELKELDRPQNARRPNPPLTFRDPGRQMLHDEMLRLWEAQLPEVLILDRSSRFPLRFLKVDWLQVFAKDARFNAVMANYRPLFEHRGEHLRFTYYVRVDGKQLPSPIAADGPRR